MDIKTIAKMANVSPATVSRVLNGKNVSPEISERVQKVIESSGYVPNYMGRSLRIQRSNTLLLLLPTIQNSFYSEIVNAFEIQARADGFRTLFGITNRNPEVEKQYLDLLFTKQVEGLASFIPTITAREINHISANYPFVALCWRGGGEIKANYVCIDNARACYEITQYLLSLGHKKIAILNGAYKERLYEQERQSGFGAAMQEAGIEVPPEYAVICDYGHQDGYKACRQLMSLPDPPTAIITLSDARAVGVVRWLKEHKLRPGRDVDVVGFDNVDISQMVEPEITTIAQPRKELGSEGAKLLISQIRDREQSARGIILQHKMIIRETTRRRDTGKGKAK